MRTLFLTGASGLVGSLLLKRLSTDTTYDHIVCLNRNNHGLKDSRTQIIHGDITKRYCGLPIATYKALATTVTDIVHAAANTSFSQSREDSVYTNIHGTQNITNFALACSKLERFCYISTVYIAGKRTGVIRESDLVHQRGFVNYYEESKYRAEVFLRSLMGRIPISVCRLSTIMGSENGTVQQFNAIHHALKLCYYGLAPFIPADPKTRVDFISEEFAVKALFQLFIKTFSAGQTYHIAAGDSASPTVSELLDLTYEAFAEAHPDWQRKIIEKPALTDWNTFSVFTESVEQLQNPILSDIVDSMKTFTPQLVYPKSFDCSTANHILTHANIYPRPVKSFYKNIVQYCVASYDKKSVQT